MRILGQNRHFGLVQLDVLAPVRFIPANGLHQILVHIHELRHTGHDEHIPVHYQMQAHRAHLLQQLNKVVRIERFGVDFLDVDFRQKCQDVIDELNGHG